ncbi:MAG TPA: hypothetical protein VE173_00505, partial [Longimicrobiales bacterium]|nr:hypothetical protein [Longimicrobiales bacterium]
MRGPRAGGDAIAAPHRAGKTGAVGSRVRLALLVVPAAAALGLAGVGVWALLPLPEDMASPPPPRSEVLEDRHGLVLRATREADGERGGWVELDRVDPELIHAFVAMEDQRFFE